MLEHGGSSAAGDVILLVTSGTASADQMHAAMALAAQKKVRVSVIAFAYGNPVSGSLRNLQALTQATGGVMTTVAAKGVGYMSHISMLIQLGDSLISALEFHQKSDADDVPVLVNNYFGKLSCLSNCCQY